MTIHTITEEITLRSKVIVHASPGERSEQVIAEAFQEINDARKAHKLNHVTPTDVSVDLPVYQSNRRWLVKAKMVFRTTIIGEPIGDQANDQTQA